MGIEQTLDTPLAEAVRRAGSQSAFARIVERNQSTVFEWLKFGKPLPAELVLAAERATGISRHNLRPDVFGSATVNAVVEPVACDRNVVSQQASA